MSKVPMPELLANSLTLGQRASLDRWATAYGDARAAEARREALEEAARACMAGLNVEVTGKPPRGAAGAR